VYSALLVGALSGLPLTVVQVWQVNPIIQSAERYGSRWDIGVYFYGARFVQTSAAHNATHGVRHTQGFPCY